MKHKLSPLGRITALISAGAMLLVLTFPIWRIELAAPQYPEGLVLKIYANRIGGDVDIVNGLNHYIGMHTLHTGDFVEFTLLPFIIGGFALLGFVVTLFNRRSLFYMWTGLFLLIACISMIDFYRWEYNYGHHLDPSAPIQVPGMAYQPPLLGYKQLLNFGAFSIPDTGGWIFIGVGVLLAGAVYLEIRRHSAETKKTMTQSLNSAVKGAVPLISLFAGLLLFSGCQNGPQPIRYGQDNCSFCKMSIADKRFGAEICTKKGKAFKYDDLHCLVAALKEASPEKKDIAGIYLVNYSDGNWILADQSFLLRSDSFRTPMNGNIAAFSTEADRSKYQAETKGKALTWKEVYP